MIKTDALLVRFRELNPWLKGFLSDGVLFTFELRIEKLMSRLRRIIPVKEFLRPVMQVN